MSELLYARVLDSVHELMQSKPLDYPAVLGGLLDYAQKGGGLDKQVSLLLFVNFLDVMYRRHETTRIETVERGEKTYEGED